MCLIKVYGTCQTLVRHLPDTHYLYDIAAEEPNIRPSITQTTTCHNQAIANNKPNFASATNVIWMHEPAKYQQIVIARKVIFY